VQITPDYNTSKRQANYVGPYNRTRSSATAEIARDADETAIHSWSLKVIRYCSNRLGMYDFLLALSSNLTSVVDRCLYITPSLLLSITPPLFQVELGKDGWE